MHLVEVNVGSDQASSVGLTLATYPQTGLLKKRMHPSNGHLNFVIDIWEGPHENLFQLCTLSFFTTAPSC